MSIRALWIGGLAGAALLIGGGIAYAASKKTESSSASSWVPATSIVRGRYYRASIDMTLKETLRSFFTTYPQDAVLEVSSPPPSDWPSDDLGAGRARISFIGANSGALPPIGGLKLYVRQTTPG